MSAASSGLRVSIDKPILPGRGLPGLPSQKVMIATLVLALLVTNLERLRPVALLVVSGVRWLFAKAGRSDAYERLTYKLRVWRGKVEAKLERVSRLVEGLLPPRAVRVLGPDDLPLTVTLVDRRSLGPDFTLHRLALPEPNQALELDLGQQLELLGKLPGKDTLTRAALVPLAYGRVAGFVEVATEKRSLDEPAGRLLDCMGVGDSIQLTTGHKLVNRHPGPVRRVVLIVSKLGVVSALQFLTALLPPSDVGVDGATVVWVNEHDDHFVFREELESLFFKHSERLDITPVCQKDLFVSELASIPAVKKAVPPPSPGTLAVVAGPEYFIEKTIRYLRSLNYGADSIVSV